METTQFTELTKETVLNLGYTQNDLNNAVYKEDYFVMPDARIFEDFNTLTTYEIVNNKVFINNIYILHNGVHIKYYFNKNWKLGYRFSAPKPRKEILNYNKNKFTYEGNKINKYNKNNIALYVEAVAKDYHYFMECFNDANTNISTNQEIFKNKGFEFRSETQASLYSKHFLMEVDLHHDGNFSLKVKYTHSGTNEEKLSLIDSLINLK